MTWNEIVKEIEAYEQEEGKDVTLEAKNVEKVKHLLSNYKLKSIIDKVSNPETYLDFNYSNLIDLSDMIKQLDEQVQIAKEEIDLDEFYKRGEVLDFDKLENIFKARKLRKKFPNFNWEKYKELFKNPMLEIKNHAGEVVKYNRYLVKKVMIGINQMIFSEMDLYVLNVGKEGCLSGDTKVQISRCKNSYKYSMEQLHKIWHKYWKNDKIKTKHDFYTRSYDGNKVRLHKIKDVIYSGKKKTYVMKLKTGETIRATDNHKFVSRNGWTRLDNLKVGDEVLIDTDKPLKRNVGRKVFKFCDPQPNAGFHPYVRKGNRVEIHRLIFEANLNNLDLFEFMDTILNEEEKTKTLKFVDPGEYHIHHIDGNHYNNHVNNLECITTEEHLKKHGTENYTNFSQGVVRFSEIVSIEYFGEEDTYDIECEDPYHNFVANNIVVHNSGKSCFASQLLLYTYTFLKEVGLIEYAYDVKKLFFSSLKSMLEVQEAQPENDYFRIMVLDEAYELNRMNFREDPSKEFKDDMRSSRKMLRIVILNLPQIGELETAITLTRTNFIFHADMDNIPKLGIVKKGMVNFYIVSRGKKIYSPFQRRNISDKEIINTLSKVMKDKNDAYKGFPDNVLIDKLTFENVWGFDKDEYDKHIKSENKKRRMSTNIKLTDYVGYIMFKKMPELKNWDFDMKDKSEKKMYYTIQKWKSLNLTNRYITNPELLTRFEILYSIDK